MTELPMIAWFKNALTSEGRMLVLLYMNTHNLRPGTKSTTAQRNHSHMPLSVPEAHLPFLIVSRPSKGPKTGSKDSSRFSIKTSSPAARARSIVSKYLWGTALVPITARLDMMLCSKEDACGTEGCSTLWWQLHTHASSCEGERGVRWCQHSVQKVALADSWLSNKENQVSYLARASNNNCVLFPKKRARASVNKYGTAWSYF